MRHTPGQDDRLRNTDETAGYVGSRIHCPIFCTHDNQEGAFSDWRNFAWDSDQRFAQEVLKKNPKLAVPPQIDPFKFAGTDGFVAVLDITKFYYYSPESHYLTDTESLLAGNWFRLLKRMDGIDIQNQDAVNRFIGNRIVPVRTAPESSIVNSDPRYHILTVQNESAAGMLPFVSSAIALTPVDRIKNSSANLELFRKQRARVSDPVNQRLARKG